MSLTATQIEVDCRGMQCPAPILELSKAARKHRGSPLLLTVQADDADFPVDVEAWCRSARAQLHGLDQHGKTYTAVIGMNGASPQPAGQAAAAAEEARRPLRLATPSPAPEQTPAPGHRRSEAKPPAPTESAGEHTIIVDCRGMQCPAPILQISRAAKARKGKPTILEIQATDGDFPVDLEAWCKSTRGRLLSMTKEGGVHTARVGLNGAGKAAPAPAAASFTPPVAPRGASATDDLVDVRGKASGVAILELGQALLAQGGSATFVADVGRFQGDVYAWAAATGAQVQDMRVEGSHVHGRVVLDADIASQVRSTPAPAPVAQAPAAAPVAYADPDAPPRENLCTLLVLHNDFENLLAALMVANTSAAQGMDVAVYFSFWGVNLLRGEGGSAGDSTEIDKPSIMQSMMKMMMPKGPARQRLGKMNMGGMGLGMMKMIMRQRNVLGLEDQMRQSEELGVTFHVCTMSMGIMGIQKQDLMPLSNLRYGGVTAFSESARRSAISMMF